MYGQGSYDPTASQGMMMKMASVKSHYEIGQSCEAGGSNRIGGRSRASLERAGSRHDVKKKSLDLRNWKESKEYAAFKKFCYHACEWKYFQGLMFFLTLFALVGDDIRVAGTSKSADPIFDGLVITCLCMFTIEICLASIGKDDYFLGFFFTLDCVATVSLILDISDVAYWMASGGEEGGDEGSVARAGRASRAGTRAGRVVRVIRLIRLVRIVKLYKQWLDRRRGKDKDVVEDEMAGEFNIGNQSRVGKKLSQLTTQRVIILVLVMLLVIPQLNINEQFDDSLSARQYGIDVVYQSWLMMQCYSGDWTSQEASICESANVDALSADDKKFAIDVVRRNFEQKLLMYVYYHNPHQESCPDGKMCAQEYMSKLFWIGHVRRDADDDTKDAFIRELVEQSDKWDSWFNDEHFSYIPGTIPSEYKGRMSKNMSSPESCPAEKRLNVNLIGVSLLGDIKCPVELRFTERTGFTAGQTVNTDVRNPRSPGFIFFFDERIRTQREALFNVGQTFFIVIVLGFGALSFSKDVNAMVLGPIEKMIQNVAKIRQDPLYAMKMGDEQFREQYEAEEEQQEQEREKNRQGGAFHTFASETSLNSQPSGLPSSMQKIPCVQWYYTVAAKWKQKRKELAEKKRKQEKKNVPMETRILENSIIKLGSLLALGFGEAGSDIIGKNLDEEAAGVQAMLPGVRVDAIYGFCDIRNFTDATEVLQHKVMVFVNQIADIVHSITDEFMGAPNKNVGDAFLLVWNISKINVEDEERRAKIADMSVMAFIKIVAAINRSPFLAEYRDHPALLARLQNYRVRMGFGLHFGYSIEGAIGSEFKIDASYLSPNVNMASRLEAATKQYGVTILISESVVNMCNEEMSEKFRAIDHVMVKGSKLPVRIYTIDLQEKNLRIDYTPRPKDKNRFKIRQQREAKKMKYLEHGFSIRALFDNDRDVRTMRINCLQDFFQHFEKGYLNYEAGEWDVAQENFEKTRKMITGGGSGDDGPSVALLTFMRDYQFEAPSHWQGYRILTEK